MPQNQKCTYKRYDKKSCSLPAEEGKELCIGHDPDENKDMNEFKLTLQGKIEKGDYDFESYVFPPDWRWEVKELKQANFRGANFKGAVGFGGIEFIEAVNFRGANFGGAADFKWAKFGGAADFKWAKFGGEANFWRAKFGDTANFWEANFGDTANFWEANFGGWADFSWANFGGKADFWRANFGDTADFRGMRLSESGVFNCDGFFEKKVYFDECKIEGLFSLAGSTFDDNVIFVESKFKGEVTFEETKFHRSVNFKRCRFLGKNTYFKNTHFFAAKDEGKKIIEVFEDIHGLHFFLAYEDKKEEDKKEGDTVDFCYSELHNVTFMRTDLRRTSFLAAKFENVEFIDVDFNDKKFFETIPFKLLPIKRREKVLFNEIIEDDSNMVQLIYLYLKKNSEDLRDYDLCGQFHMGEMEMALKNADSWLKKFFIGGYKLFSGYGERYTLAFWWNIFFIAFFAVLYFFTGIKITGNADIIYHNFWHSIGYSILSWLPFLRGGFYQPGDCPYSLAFTIIESVLGPILLTLLLLALRRRFKR